MGIKDWLIKKLEKDVEFDHGYIELEQLSKEEREKLFVEFGEGSIDLTNFLKTAFNHNAPSIFCCSGHGIKSPYVVLRVNDENKELLQKLGKVLSNQNITTTFTNHHLNGKIVSFHPISSSPSTDWLKMAAQIMENPELFDDSNPSIYYHEKMMPSNKPFLFDFKKNLLNYLRGKDTNKLPAR